MEGTTNVAVEFVSDIVEQVTTAVPLTTIGSILGAIIAGGLIYYFAMTYGRKAFAAVKSALAGRGFRI